MGLAISRPIIESFGGNIWVTANSPRGAVFQFSLPAVSAMVGGDRVQDARPSDA